MLYIYFTNKLKLYYYCVCVCLKQRFCKKKKKNGNIIDETYIIDFHLNIARPKDKNRPTVNKAKFCECAPYTFKTRISFYVVHVKTTSNSPGLKRSGTMWIRQHVRMPSNRIQHNTLTEKAQPQHENTTENDF